jgi:hypothetical protein
LFGLFLFLEFICNGLWERSSRCGCLRNTKDSQISFPAHHALDTLLCHIRFAPEENLASVFEWFVDNVQFTNTVESANDLLPIRILVFCIAFLSDASGFPEGVIWGCRFDQDCVDVDGLPLPACNVDLFDEISHIPFSVGWNEGHILLPNVRDDGSPLAFGMTPAREAGSAGGMTKVPKAW